MCRLFGFRSVTQSQVHRSLLEAENAFGKQSRKHSDGWGLAYYVARAPHLIKSTKAAIEDSLFNRVGGAIASQTVVAHLRKATTGEINVLNCHPFQHGQWVFAHNGQVSNYAAAKAEIHKQIAPNLARYILGGTDSEAVFFLFLTQLARLTDIHRAGTPIEPMVEALSNTVNLVFDIADTEEPSKFSVILSNGQSMLAMRRITTLHYSTYKHSCVEEHRCPFFNKSCTAPTEDGFVTHLLVSSEPLKGENAWTALDDMEFIGADWRMGLYHGRIQRTGGFLLERDYRPPKIEA